MIDISIVIVNYKTAGLVKQSLKRINNMNVKFSFETIVVDNNSNDGCIKMIHEYFPNVKTVANEMNIGYGAGNNAGIKTAKGRYILIINPDVAPLPLEIEKLYQFLEKRNDVALVGPRLINPDGTIQFTCLKFPTTFIPIYSRTYLKNFKRFKKIYNSYRMIDFDHKKTIPVEWLMGACMLIRKNIYDEIGGFDERYFMYYEDVDLCRTLWQEGYKVYYLPESEMVHYYQRLSADDGFFHSLSKKTLYYHLSSWRKYAQKYISKTPPHIENSN